MNGTPLSGGPVHEASCHCGGVRFRLRLEQGLVNLRRCNCSLCRRRGAIVASVALADLTIDRGQELLRRYQFNTMTASHYFCSQCGIYTHHQRRSKPTEFGFNVGCLEGVDPYTLGEIPTLDGVNHPSDR